MVDRRIIILTFVLIMLFISSCSGPPSSTDLHIDITLTSISQRLNVTPTHPTQISTHTPKSTSTEVVIPTEKEIPKTSLTSTENSISHHVTELCIPNNISFQIGTVTQVIDGDTIHVLLEDGNTYRVRYIGIDAPESERPFYTESLNANLSLVANKEVYLYKDISETDQYDRLLRYVIVGNTFVNLELVRMGLAEAEDYPPDSSCTNTFLTAENEARADQLGMWVATQTPEPSAPHIIILTVNKQEEWVDIQNTGNIDVDLSGWNLVSERGNQDCPLSGTIKAGETLRIWAMATQGPGYSCGYKTNIWNNSEPDPAVLYNPQGIEVSRK
jgi:endonuclease YncB( thermonuclease family)